MNGMTEPSPWPSPRHISDGHTGLSPHPPRDDEHTVHAEPAPHEAEFLDVALSYLAAIREGAV